MGERIKVKLNTRIIAFYVLIMCTIINKNEFSGGIRFVLVPVLVSMALFLYYNLEFGIILKPHYYWNVLFCLSEIGSTFFSKIPNIKRIDVVILEAIIWLCLYILATSNEYHPEELKAIIDFYIVFTAFLSVSAIILFFTGALEEGRATFKIFGQIKDQNFVAAFLCPAVPVLLSKMLFSNRPHIINTFVFVSILIAVFFLGSRGAFLSIFGSSLIIVAYFLIKKRDLRLAIMVLMFFLLSLILFYAGGALSGRMLSTDSYTNDVRLYIWGFAIKAFTTNPLFGNGRGANEVFAMRSGSVTHNTYIEILGDQGLLGMASFLMILYNPFKNVLKTQKVFAASLLVASFLPLLFISAYSTINFWLPIILFTIICDYLSTNTFPDLFF